VSTDAPEAPLGGGNSTMTLSGYEGKRKNLKLLRKAKWPTARQNDQADVLRMPAAGLLAAALEQEDKVATLEETYEELIR
jgi:hypothetical protein